jgi:hypothetical protein
MSTSRMPSVGVHMSVQAYGRKWPEVVDRKSVV